VLNFGIVLAMHFFPPTAALFAKVALLMLVMSSVGLVVGSEVSERHRLANDLNAQTTYLDSLIQNSPLGIVVLDRAGRVELTNSAFERLFQYKRSEFVSIDIRSLVVPDDDSPDLAQLIPQIFAGTALHRTVKQRRQDGKTLDLALHGVPLLLNGEVRGAYLMYEDVSEQTKAAEAQRPARRQCQCRQDHASTPLRRHDREPATPHLQRPQQTHEQLSQRSTSRGRSSLHRPSHLVHLGIFQPTKPMLVHGEGRPASSAAPSPSGRPAPWTSTSGSKREADQQP